jgi:hypothetical protein
MAEEPDGPDRRPLPPMDIEDPARGSYRKVRGRPGRDPVDPDEPLAVVIEVAEPGYRPAGVDVRAVLSETLFTATVAAADLAGLDRDPRVVAVELGGRLDQID